METSRERKDSPATRTPYLDGLHRLQQENQVNLITVWVTLPQLLTLSTWGLMKRKRKMHITQGLCF